MPRHEIVVCTENTGYLVWETMLFHFSCVTHLGRPPIVVVHQQGEPLLPGFEQIRATGGRLQLSPNYRDLNGLSYPPRNTAGSLRHVETDADYLVLCDSAMLFLQSFPFDELILSDRQISFDYCGYLQPDAPEHQPTLDDVCRQAGINPRRLRKPLMDGGVPHVIPTRWQGPLSESWFAMMELFPTIGTEDYGQPRKSWLTAMWALVLSMHRLKLKAVSTRLCLTNCQEDLPLPLAQKCCTTVTADRASTNEISAPPKRPTNKFGMFPKMTVRSPEPSAGNFVMLASSTASPDARWRLIESVRENRVSVEQLPLLPYICRQSTFTTF